VSGFYADVSARGKQRGRGEGKATDDPAFLQPARSEEVPKRSTASGAFPSAKERGVREEKRSGGFFCLFVQPQNPKISPLISKTEFQSDARYRQPEQASAPLPAPRSQNQDRECPVPI
jgi:hypothetical protein